MKLHRQRADTCDAAHTTLYSRRRRRGIVAGVLTLAVLGASGCTASDDAAGAAVPAAKQVAPDASFNAHNDRVATDFVTCMADQGVDVPVEGDADSPEGATFNTDNIDPDAWDAATQQCEHLLDDIETPVEYADPDEIEQIDECLRRKGYDIVDGGVDPEATYPPIDIEDFDRDAGQCARLVEGVDG